jgi:hypothetical protein
MQAVRRKSLRCADSIIESDSPEWLELVASGHQLPRPPPTGAADRPPTPDTEALDRRGGSVRSCRTHTQQKQRAISPSDHREGGHRPAH